MTHTRWWVAERCSAVVHSLTSPKFWNPGENSRPWWSWSWSWHSNVFHPPSLYRLFKANIQMWAINIILFIILLTFRELPTQLIDLLMTATNYYIQRRQWRGRHRSCFCWCCVGNLKIHAPTYVASLPSAWCPVLLLSSLDPVFLLVWSWQQNAGTFPLMCHCVAHIRSLSTWHTAGVILLNLFSTVCIKVHIKLGKKRAKSGSRKAHSRYKM